MNELAEIVVIGDVMLDVFSEGRVERISPEAPVAVLHNPLSANVVGGAANCAVNIRTLGEHAALVGVVGDDTAGSSVRAGLTAASVRDRLVGVQNWTTIVKQRFMAGGQQILRVDHELPLWAQDVEAALLDGVDKHLRYASAVVISDYDKGCVTDRVARACVTAANRRNLPCVVDSKRIDPSVFIGCTVIAPNLSEARRMTGAADPSSAAARIASLTRSAVIVTMGSEGMLVRDQVGRETHIHSHAQEVIDVTGAGDTVTAGLAVSLARGKSLVESANYANRAAAVAVSHSGTHPVTAQEVEQTRGWRTINL